MGAAFAADARWRDVAATEGIGRERRHGDIARGTGEGRRVLICRQAARKFDAETADRLSGVLDGLADVERLAEVGEWIIECETGDELLDRAERTRRRV